MSRQHRVGRFDGVERADSLTWNPHKVFFNVFLLDFEKIL